MAKFSIGCHVISWGGLARDNLEPVFRQIAEAGYAGVEGLWFNSSEELVEAAAVARAYGLHIVMAHGRTSGQIIRYNAALGNRACEIWEGPIQDLGLSRDEQMKKAAAFFDPIFKKAARYRMRLYHHIHLCQLVVTNNDVDLMVRLMPDMGILLDTGHLTAAGGDVMRVLKDHGQRVLHVHLKDFYKASSDWDPDKWDSKKGYFVPLGEGNCGLDIKRALKELEKIGYDGWVNCELDPIPAGAPQEASVSELIKHNRRYLRSLGY